MAKTNIMEKPLLILGLLISLWGFAQDGYKLSPEQYKEITNMISQLDSISAKTFSDKIAATAKTSLALENIKSNSRTVIFYYSPEGMAPEEKEKQETRGCESCLKVVFLKYEIGGSKDLQTKGEQFLKFSEASGLYLDLFPTWEREFLSGADPEAALESFRQREVKSREYNCNISIQKTSSIWKIYNWN